MGGSVQDSSFALREFRASYREHHGFVWHALYRFGLDTGTIEDAVQDVFMVAYRRRDVRRSRSTKAWLYGIARRVASNHRRAAGRHAARVEALAGTAAVGQRPTPEAVVDLDRHLSGLAPADRELFLLSELEGLSGPEIAKLLGCNVNTVYTRIRKLRTQLPDGTAISSARRARPRASKRGWAALLPVLETSSLAKGVGLGASVGSGATLGWSVVGALAVSAIVGWSVTRTGEVASPVIDPASRTHVPKGELTPLSPQPQVDAGAQALEAALPSDTPEAKVLVERTSALASGRRSARQEKQAETRTSSLARENAMLEDANEALREHDYAMALRRADEHARTFPASVLADVASAVRIRALCGLGKTPQARAEARLLTARHPTMAVVRRLAKSCAASPRVPADLDTTGI